MAVAMMVSSVGENPASAASSRPRLRAVTTSASEPMGMRTSPATESFLLSVEQRLAEPGAPGTGEQMAAGVEVLLAAPVPGGQGQQHRAAVSGWRFRLFQL